MNELTKPQIRKYKIDRAKLFKGSMHSIYVREDIAIAIIIQSRLSDLKTIKFRADLGFNQINLILKKEQSVAIPLLKAFSAEKIELQHKVLKKERIIIDMYFSEIKFVIEIDEKDHIEENERKIKIEKYSDFRFVHRINPDVNGFDIFLEISNKRTYITQSNKEKLKSKFAKELLSYMSSISKPLKQIKYFVKKSTTHIVKHEKHTIKNKADKIWKKTWNNLLFRV